MSDRRVIELAETNVDHRDLAWLKQALQWAIELEFFTIPPYLTAFWSVKDSSDPVAVAIREVLIEEMLHMSLACNMLVSIGGIPKIDDPEVVPRYPNPMPGGVKPLLTVALEGLSETAIRTFMAIEEPETDISTLEAVRADETFTRIGEFYDAIENAFYGIDEIESLMTREGQVEGYFGETQQPDGSDVPKSIGTLSEVSAAIKLIKDQGEGTSEDIGDPDTGELAHYYRFKEIDVGKKLVFIPGRDWVHAGPEVAMPDRWPVVKVPPGGYRIEDVDDENVWANMQQFDVAYTKVIRQLQLAWTPDAGLEGGQAALHKGLELMMSDLPRLARQIMQVSKDNQNQNYAPNFRYVPDEVTQEGAIE